MKTKIVILLILLFSTRVIAAEKFEEGDKRFALLFAIIQPGTLNLIWGYFPINVQFDIAIDQRSHLNINVDANIDLQSPSSVYQDNEFSLGLSYRFMLWAISKWPGVTSLNGFYIAPTVAFNTYTSYDTWEDKTTTDRNFSFGMEIGQQWTFPEGFLIGCRLGIAYPSRVSDYEAGYLIPGQPDLFGITGGLDIGYAF
ncbi:MAG: hypothetical protein ABUK01_17190 [Leptospirales bacterium]